MYERNRAQGAVHFTVSDNGAGSARLSTNQIVERHEGISRNDRAEELLDTLAGMCILRSPLIYLLFPPLCFLASEGNTEGQGKINSQPCVRLRSILVAEVNVYSLEATCRGPKLNHSVAEPIDTVEGLRG